MALSASGILVSIVVTTSVLVMRSEQQIFDQQISVVPQTL